MPRIPHITSSPDMPFRSGAQRRVLGVPTPDFPTLDPNVPAQIGRAVQQLGRDMAEAAGHIAAAEERQRRARDAVKSLDASTQAIQELDAYYGEQQREADYELLPERMRQKSQELLAKYGANLSPQARATFQGRFSPHVEGLHRSAIAWVDKRGVAQAEVVRGELEAVHFKGAMEADSAEKQAYHRIAYETGLQSLVDEGYYPPAIVDQGMRKFDDTLTMNEAAIEVRRNPTLAGQMIQRRIDGQSGGPVFDRVPESALPELQTQALQWENAKVGQQRENTRWLESRTQETQKQHERALYELIIKTNPTPENAPLIRSYQDEITRRSSDLSPEGSMRLQNLARSMLDKALQPAPEQDDAALVRDVRTMIYDARTPEEIRKIEQYVSENRARMKQGTYGEILGRLSDRQKENHYTNRDSYRDGVTIIRRAGFVPGEPQFPGAPQVPDTIKAGILLALDAFDQKMSELAKQDITLVDTNAKQMAEQLRDIYVPLDSVYSDLPPTLKDKTTEAEMQQELQRMKAAGASEDQLIRLRKLWMGKQKDAQERQQQQQSQQPAAGQRAPRR